MYSYHICGTLGVYTMPSRVLDLHSWLGWCNGRSGSETGLARCGASLLQPMLVPVSGTWSSQVLITGIPARTLDGLPSKFIRPTQTVPPEDRCSGVECPSAVPHARVLRGSVADAWRRQWIGHLTPGFLQTHPSSTIGSIANCWDSRSDVPRIGESSFVFGIYSKRNTCRVQRELGVGSPSGSSAMCSLWARGPCISESPPTTTGCTARSSRSCRSGIVWR